MNPLRPFCVMVGDDDLFGSCHDIPVKRIVELAKLQEVHKKLVEVCGQLLHDSTYRQPYNPHISYPEQFGIETGQKIYIGGFAVVFCERDNWRVIDKVGFKGELNR